MFCSLGSVSRLASAVTASSVARARSIRGRMWAPKAVWVTPRGDRSNSFSPRRSSSLAIPFDKAGWVTPYARAAALNDFVSATACA